MSRYCRTCGKEVAWRYGESEMWCPCCERIVTFEDIIAGHTREARVNQLREMHALMCNANDENIYYNHWIYLMPDEATEEDFIDIASNDDLYNECFDLFIKLIAKKGNRY